MGIKKTLCVVLLTVGAMNAWATPPTHIVLSYDAVKKMLHVSAAHPSDHLDRHYLRRIVIYKNDVEANTVTLPRQKAPSGIEEDISFNAEAGDKLSVEIFCSKGGTGKGEVTVPILPKDDQKK